ncbi:MAG: ribonuclease III [Steroidobacteraceae bacterium]|jgi:ribonuclease-3|nr:ribonuclease III [Gammaproteobacteria bacterium]
MQSDWPQRWLSETLGLAPRDASLYAAALTHRSAGGRNNERLEFLGDAVLNLLAAEMLYAHFPRASEGDLSRFRARLVSAEPLAAIAVRLGVGEQLQLGSGELKSGGFRRESILADAIEALIGATYLDAGLDGARVLVTRLFDGALEQLPTAESLKDPKTRLQERLQARGVAVPTYTVTHTTGEPHAQTFEVRCEIAALDMVSDGSGSSRRRAEQDAAQRLLAQLEARNEP